jgi:glutamate synthase domain-containing protein 3
MTHSPDSGSVALISVPEVRDYQRINAELAQQLDRGVSRVRLTGAEGQRLLVAGLAGGWRAVVEVEGRAGPELAAALNAPGVTVVCHGPADDGAGRGLRAGRLLILGNAGEALGYAQEGGTIVAARAAGPRAGLNQKGGVLIVLGDVGRLAGERQLGGRLFAHGSRLGPHAARGRRGGRLVSLGDEGDGLEGIDADDTEVFRNHLNALAPWLEPTG